MHLVLGVCVAANTARLALVDTAAPETAIDEFDIDLTAAAPDTLRSTIVGTDGSLRDSGHILSGTRISASDEDFSAELRDALTDAGLIGVTVVSPSAAATSIVRRSAAAAGQQTSALLFVDENTAALSVVGADADTTSVVAIEPVGSTGPVEACTELLARLAEEPGGAEGLYVVGTGDDTAGLARTLAPTSPIPVRSVASPAFAVARGAALATAPAAFGAAEAMSGIGTAPAPQIGEHLAYSLDPDSSSTPLAYVDDFGGFSDVPMQSPMASLSHTDDPTEVEDDLVPASTGGRPRILLVGSTIAAIVVVGFAALAVVVAISIKPSATIQAIRGDESVPGKYLPTMPGQGTQPVEDPAVFLPPVVPVEEKPAATGDGGRTIFAGANRGRYSPSAGVGDGGTRTVFVTQAGPPGVGGGGVVLQPPRNAFRLNDWLPRGMNINMRVFSKTGRCKPGDIRCVYEATGGCLPGSQGFDTCIEKKFGLGCERSGEGCVQTEVVTVSDDCSKVTTGMCQKPEPIEALENASRSTPPESSCPTGATCRPLVVSRSEDEGSESLPGSQRTDTQVSTEKPGTETQVGAETPVDPSGPTTDVVKPADEQPRGPLFSPKEPDAPLPNPAPAEGILPPAPPAVSGPDNEPGTRKPIFRQPEPPAPEPAPVAPPVEVPAPPVEAPPPPRVVREAPVSPPVIEAPAPVIEAPAPAPVIEAPAVPAAPPERPRLELPKLRDILGNLGGGRNGRGGSDSPPETTIVETPPLS
ncbi:MAG: hypothetical protein AB1925_04110 [Actinomycetota bacterium]